MSRRNDRPGSHIGSTSKIEKQDDRAEQERKTKHGSHLALPKHHSRSTSGQKDPPNGSREHGDEKKRSSKKSSKKGSRIVKIALSSPESHYSDQKKQAALSHDERLHTSQVHSNDQPPPPPTMRAPPSDSPKSPSKKSSSKKERGSRIDSGKRRSSKKDKKASLKSSRKQLNANSSEAPLPSSPTPTAAIAATPPPIPAKPQRESPPISVFVTMECSLYALRIYLFIAEKNRNYIEAPVPEPEWLAKHTHELVGVAFEDSAATASLPSMRLIERATPQPKLFPEEPELEELIDFLDQELTAGVHHVLMNPTLVGWRPRLLAAFQRVESLLSNSTSSYLLPSGFSIADILAAVCISALPQLSFFRGFDLPSMPNLEEYKSVLLSRPALSRTLYTTDEWRNALKKQLARSSVTSHNMFQHVALRALYTQLTDFVGAQKNRWTVESLAELRARWYRFKLFLDSHTKVEDEILFPALEAFSPGCVQNSDADGVSHKALSAQLQALSTRVIALSHMLPPSPVASPSVVFERLLPDLLAFKDASLRHMLGEEKQITPVLAAEAEQYPSRVQALMERMARAVSPAEQWLLLPLIITSLDMPSAEQYFFNLKQLLPPQDLAISLAIAERTLPEEVWSGLQQRCDFFPPPFAVPAFCPLRATPRVLVLGVHTPVGESLLRLLLQHTPFSFRVALHESSLPAELSGAPSSGVQLAKIQLRDTASLAAVFWGIERLFLSLSPRSVAHLPRIAAAAAAAGVKHVVAVDTRHTMDLAARQLRSTILQPACFFSSLVSALPTAQREGRLRLPLESTARLAPLSEADLAEIAMHALAAPPPEQSVTYQLAGDLLTPADIATCFGEHLGKRVRFDQEETEAWATESTEVRGEAETEALLALWQRANRCDDKSAAALSEAAQNARRLLDREPTSLATHLASLGAT